MLDQKVKMLMEVRFELDMVPYYSVLDHHNQ